MVEIGQLWPRGSGPGAGSGSSPELWWDDFSTDRLAEYAVATDIELISGHVKSAAAAAAGRSLVTPALGTDSYDLSGIINIGGANANISQGLVLKYVDADNHAIGVYRRTDGVMRIIVTREGSGAVEATQDFGGAVTFCRCFGYVRGNLIAIGASTPGTSEALPDTTDILTYDLADDGHEGFLGAGVMGGAGLSLTAASDTETEDWGDDLHIWSVPERS
jgi:hypothetical protein